MRANTQSGLADEHCCVNASVSLNNNEVDGDFATRANITKDPQGSAHATSNTVCIGWCVFVFVCLRGDWRFI